MSFFLTGNYDNAILLAIIIPIIVLVFLATVISVVIFVTKKRFMSHLVKNRLHFNFQGLVQFFIVFLCMFPFRNSDRLGNGVLYASVNPEYFSPFESEYYLNFV